MSPTGSRFNAPPSRWLVGHPDQQCRVADYDDLSDRIAIERHLAVNFFGTYDVVAAFLPKLLESRGTIVNNSSLNALAPLPLIPAYSISKAATFNLTQSLRALLAPRGGSRTRRSHRSGRH